MREIIRVLGKLKMILITYHLEVNYFYTIILLSFPCDTICKRRYRKEVLEMNKRNRVMEIFYRFMSGEHMAVKDLAAEYEVSEKSIQRDISEIKFYGRIRIFCR